MPAKATRERIMLRGCPHLPAVQILVVDECEPRAWKAYHETFTTCVALKARSPAAPWVYRGKTHFASPGGLMMMEPGEIHANTKEVHGATFRVLMIPPIMMARAVGELGGSSSQIHFKIAQTFDPSLFAAFRDLHCSFENNASRLEQESRFHECLLLLAQECVESPAASHAPQIHSAGVRRVKERLHESVSENLGLDELAGLARVSKYHFSRVFKREVGVAPHDFQIQLKLSAARSLLRKGLSISQSAADAGFNDQSHFTRLFRKSLGVTPKTYAESVRPPLVFFPDATRPTAPLRGFSGAKK